MGFLLFSMVLGITLGICAAIENWSRVRTMCYGVLLTVAVFYLFNHNARASIGPASETPFDKLKPATLHVAIGSAFIVEAPSGKHYLITNWHVCNAGSWLNRLQASAENGTSYVGTIVKKDPRVDLCAIPVPLASPALKVAKSLSVGQDVYTRGYPYQVLSESAGKFLRMERWGYDFPIQEVGKCFPGSKEQYDPSGVLQGCYAIYDDNMTSLYSRPGSSGSPVVNSKGEIVGVISSWSGKDDLAGMVKLESVQDFLKGL